MIILRIFLQTVVTVGPEGGSDNRIIEKSLNT